MSSYVLFRSTISLYQFSVMLINIFEKNEIIIPKNICLHDLRVATCRPILKYIYYIYIYKFVSIIIMSELIGVLHLLLS